MTLVLVHGGVSTRAPDGGLPSLRACFDGPLPGSAVDAVEHAVRVMEDDPLLNAGWGAVLTTAGTAELDAGIADGSTGAFGGVATVRVRHPVSLARRVLEDTPHVLLSGDGAMALAGGMEILSGTTEAQRSRWERARAEGVLGAGHYGRPGADTVGAVAVGDDGSLAAASSSGGVFGKLPGRVGDACIFGAGVYASGAAAVVGTGIGEAFIETLAAAHAGALIEGGADPADACAEAVARVYAHRRVSAGLLALDRRGRAGAAFRGQTWAVEGPEGPLEARCLGPV